MTFYAADLADIGSIVCVHYLANQSLSLPGLFVGHFRTKYRVIIKQPGGCQNRMKRGKVVHLTLVWTENIQIRDTMVSDWHHWH